MALLIPSWLDFAGWAGVLFATLVLIGFGRLLTAGRAAPEAALVVGWGGAALVLTLWGVASMIPLRLPAIAIAALGGCALVWPRLRLGSGEWRVLWRVAVLALPLAAVLASARPSLPDTFLNLLPNAAYLYDHQFFPADARPPAHSFIAGAPYNLQLAALIAALVTPGFPPNAMIGLNLVLQLAAAVLLARLVAGTEDDTGAPPSWSATALGLLLATALNPGFAPRYHLSAYSEPSVTVALAFAGWFAARALERMSAGRGARLDLWLMALALAALVNVKQEAVAMAVGVTVAAGVLALDGRAHRLHRVGPVALAALPAAILYLAWRWYVLTHFAVGELKPLPFAQWNLAALPRIAASMLREMGEKIVWFAVFASVVGAVAWWWRRQGPDLGTRLGALLAGTFLVYNAALVFAYVAHFPGEMGASAHSYFRYISHLSLLLMLALVLLLRTAAHHRRWALSGPGRRIIPALLVAAVLLAPLPFLRYLRFDLEVPQQRAWTLAKHLAAHVADGERIALLLPGDNGSVATMIEGVLRLTPPRRNDVELLVLADVGPGSLDEIAAAGYRVALLSCAVPGIAGVPPGSAALLERGAAGWRVVSDWPYAPAPPRGRWSHVLADSTLCLGDR